MVFKTRQRAPRPKNALEPDLVLAFSNGVNFGVKKEKMRGSFHTTHEIAYQLETPGNMARSDDVHVPKSGDMRGLLFGNGFVKL